jgi:hypothetical protein
MPDNKYAIYECSKDKYPQYTGYGQIINNTIYCRKRNSWDLCPIEWEDIKYKNVNYYCKDNKK